MATKKKLPIKPVPPEFDFPGGENANQPDIEETPPELSQEELARQSLDGAEFEKWKASQQ